MSYPFKNKISNSNTEKTLIKELAKREFNIYLLWAEKIGLKLDSNLIFSVVYIFAGTCPYKDQFKSREIGIKLTLWIFRLDDLIDSTKLTPEEVNFFIKQLPNSIRNNTVTLVEDNNFSIVIKVLKEIKALLTTFFLYKAMKRKFINSLELMLNGMIYENKLTLDNSIYSKYILNAKYTIGVPLVIDALIISFNDKDILNQSKSFNNINQNIFKAVRLANDLSTQDKEIVEGKVNSLSILLNTKFKHNQLSNVKNYIRQKITNYYDKYYTTMNKFKTNNRRIEISIPRLFDISLKLYQTSFIRDLTKETINI